MFFFLPLFFFLLKKTNLSCLTFYKSSSNFSANFSFALKNFFLGLTTLNNFFFRIPNFVTIPFYYAIKISFFFVFVNTFIKSLYQFSKIIFAIVLRYRYDKITYINDIPKVFDSNIVDTEK